MTVRPGKKFGFQSAAENLQRQRRPDRIWQTVPDNFPVICKIPQDFWILQANGQRAQTQTQVNTDPRGDLPGIVSSRVSSTDDAASACL